MLKKFEIAFSVNYASKGLGETNFFPAFSMALEARQRLLLVMFNASARKYSGINTSYQKLLHFWNNSYCDFPLVLVLVGRIEDYNFECLGIGRIRVD